LGLLAPKSKKKKPRVNHEPRSAHGRAVNKNKNENKIAKGQNKISECRPPCFAGSIHDMTVV